jgi:hypothetical protein
MEWLHNYCHPFKNVELNPKYFFLIDKTFEKDFKIKRNFS